MLNLKFLKLQVEYLVWANLAKNSENLAGRPFDCHKHLYKPRGGVQMATSHSFPSQRSPELHTSAAAVIRATISSISASLYHRQPRHCRSCVDQDLALATATVILVCTIAPCTFQSVSVAALTEPSVSLHHARTSPVCSLAQPEPSLPCLRFSFWCPVPAFDHLSSLAWLVQSCF